MRCTSSFGAPPNFLLISNIDEKIFSMNKIWDKLISNNELYAIESNVNFLHVSTLNIYKNLLEENLDIK